MPEATRYQNLRLALRANASFSSICGLTFVFAHSSVGAYIGVPGPLVLALGVGLLSFAGLLLATAARRDEGRLRTEARVHCAADLAWVVGAVPIVALGLLTRQGALGLIAVSSIVLALAIAQFRGLSQAGEKEPGIA